ncbi:sporulation protein YqfC [Anoxybacter fermentans]|uniref:Sporulation protein YqfC n=1 Tax=Anoxybacter fermentans TaxID=1323375 RepID=A0A3S9SY42_9FIRM|nr:sporulation protein YqfC [Anoxybacter fermentans]AZR73158.1 sporulation protein YqfC [Anoxybacter fermentans]
MGIKKRFTDRFINTFGLPPEVILKLPLIMMVGGKSLILENHRGVLEYGRERIRIRLQKGEILLIGRNLVIESISDEEIQIRGEITGLSLGEEVIQA